jgi:hypothetical protein
VSITSRLIIAFIKEIALGDSDLKQTVKRNKMASFLFVAFILMFIMFLYLSEQNDKLIAEVTEYKVAALNSKFKVPDSPGPNIPNNGIDTPVLPSREPKPTTHKKDPVLRNKLDSIRKEEDAL